MANDKAGGTTGFRPRGKTAERLEFAERFGINRSELINRILEDHLRNYLAREVEKKRTQLKQTLEMSLP